MREKPSRRLRRFDPTVIFHLAGAKHAPQGELDPYDVLDVNSVGTENVLCQFPDAKVIFTSTCKAADPETAYGASKLIAERMVLNAGGVVARLFNVMEASGNVFEIWDAIPEEEPLPVMPCQRFFIHMPQVVYLLLRCVELPSGRYAPDPGLPRWMDEVAREVYPDRALVWRVPRRGDRKREPMHAGCETWVPLGDGIARIDNPHDPQGGAACL